MTGSAGTTLVAAARAAAGLRSKHREWMFGAARVHGGWAVEARAADDPAGTCIIGTPGEIETATREEHAMGWFGKSRDEQAEEAEEQLRVAAVSHDDKAAAELGAIEQDDGGEWRIPGR